MSDFRVVRSSPIKTPPTHAHRFQDNESWPTLTHTTDPDLIEKAATRICADLVAENIPAREPHGNRFNYMNHRFEACGDIRRAADGQYDYIWIPATGQWGNNIIQLAHAIITAAAHGIGRIHHPITWLPEKVWLHNGMGLIFGDPDITDGRAGIRNGFFRHDGNWACRMSSPTLFARILREVVRPVVPWTPTPVAEGVVTAHLRGGDVLTVGQYVHPRYGQPPLAFYRKAVLNIFERHEVNRLQIVSMDDKNPVVEPLARWARQNGIETVMQRGDIDEDLCCLHATRHMIGGYSSFTAVAALLSEHINSYSYFNRGFVEAPIIASVPEVYHGVDTSQDYIRWGEWKNTPEQRQQMVDFEDRFIELRPVRRPYH